MKRNKWRIESGDVRDVLKGMPDNFFDGVFCDPPYEIGIAGKSWDRQGTAFDVGMWAQVCRVVKPGAYVLAFGGTRTFHRLFCAVEDAGFEVRDCLSWLYAQGFPNSVSAGRSNELWWGYGTALKPAWEPCLLARKPLDGTLARNMEKFGTGALSIEGNRIESEGGQGRWPANLLHDGSPDFPDAQGQQGDLVGHDKKRIRGASGVYGDMGPSKDHIKREETNKSAGRFFFCAKASASERKESGFTENGEPVLHPCVKPLELCRHLASLILPPENRPNGPRRLLTPFSGSGSEMIGALQAGWDSVTGIENDARYVKMAQNRLNLRHYPHF